MKVYGRLKISLLAIYNTQCLSEYVMVYVIIYLLLFVG